MKMYKVHLICYTLLQEHPSYKFRFFPNISPRAKKKKTNNTTFFFKSDIVVVLNIS
jgi:hypothetical protein